MATETINSEVQLVFRKKTRGQVIGAELQEGFAHIGVAATEAGRLAAEQLGPRVVAAREVAGPRLDAAQKAAQKAVVPKVAAAVAVAAPAVASARDSLAPRMEAVREAIGPRVEAAREAAAPRVSSAMSAAQEAALRAAADLGPRVEAAQKAAQRALKDDVVPRLGAAQTAAVAYAVPRVMAARDAVTPALESARETLAAGVDSALSELDARRAEFVATAETSTRKARKTAKKARKTAVQKRHEFERKAAATAKQVKQRGRVAPEPRRWPWLLAALALAAGVVVVLRGKKEDSWTPAPAGDGPVPSYREDPVPSSPSTPGKAVSDAQGAAGDATPAESDLGVRDAQLVEGDDTGTTTTGAGTPGTATDGSGSDAGPTAGPADKQV
jgi:hypothetical protein